MSSAAALPRQLPTETRYVMGHLITRYPSTGNFDLMMIQTPPGQDGPPPHFHQDFSESFVVVSGIAEFLVEDQRMKRRAGEHLDVPPRTVHAFRNASAVEPLVMFNVYSPKGFGEFVEQIGILASEPHADRESACGERMRRFLATAAEYDIFLAI
ncbi:cupin domain-containing protein [Pontibacter sp. G13]|uniref:cupin domain-containing protein n=1 Tax=Pontibacter sp. G13 TaxID=3074898 RepID=UPI00288A3D61|nr:cupin domain-containing protein [Pontibacter sp. G13]WNJ20203.1 cupin domain-containing protein [Pontibacter sp. G13]